MGDARRQTVRPSDEEACDAREIEERFADMERLEEAERVADYRPAEWEDTDDDY